MISIYLAHSRRVVCEGLQGLFAGDMRFVVVGDAANGADALRGIRLLRPDFAIVEQAASGLDGIRVARLIAEEGLSTHCIVLTEGNEDESTLRASHAGAKGCLRTVESFEELGILIQKVAAGDWGPPWRPPLAPSAPGEPGSLLTRRELEVLCLVARGQTSKQIAYALFISPRTVDTHRYKLMQKLQITNGPGLVKYALEHGFV